MENPLEVSEFKPDTLASGSIAKLNVELVTDALGVPIVVPVMVVKGREEGPVLGIVSTLHGNELNGILVIHELFKHLDPAKVAGTIVGIPVLNVPGYLFNQREFIDGVDLNHIMPGDPQGNQSEVFASRLVDRIISRFDFIMDFHTASFGRDNSHYVRANLAQEKPAWMAKLQHASIIVHSIAPETTLRGTCTAMGIPGITIELGSPQTFQPRLVRDSLEGILNIAKGLGMIGGEIALPEKGPLICKHSFWLRTRAGGVLHVLPGLTDRVEKGDVVARINNVFGELMREVLSPESGVVVGKNMNPVATSGARVIHLGLLASDEDTFKEKYVVKEDEEEDDD